MRLNGTPPPPGCKHGGLPTPECQKERKRYYFRSDSWDPVQYPIIFISFGRMMRRGCFHDPPLRHRLSNCLRSEHVFSGKNRGEQVRIWNGTVRYLIPPLPSSQSSTKITILRLFACILCQICPFWYKLCKQRWTVMTSGPLVLQSLAHKFKLRTLLVASLTSTETN